MTLKDDVPLPYDSEVFEEINTHLTLIKDTYHGTLSCSNDYLRRVEWYDTTIQKYLNRKISLIKIYEIWKFIGNIPNLRQDILYVPYFECDRRYYSGRREKIKVEDEAHVKEILDELSSKENIEKLWKSKASMLFLFSHKMFKAAHETRYFKWMMKNKPKHHYKVYGINPPNIPKNPMSFIHKK